MATDPDGRSSSTSRTISAAHGSVPTLHELQERYDLAALSDACNGAPASATVEQFRHVAHNRQYVVSLRQTARDKSAVCKAIAVRVNDAAAVIKASTAEATAMREAGGTAQQSAEETELLVKLNEAKVQYRTERAKLNVEKESLESTKLALQNEEEQLQRDFAAWRDLNGVQEASPSPPPSRPPPPSHNVKAAPASPAGATSKGPPPSAMVGDSSARRPPPPSMPPPPKAPPTSSVPQPTRTQQGTKSFPPPPPPPPKQSPSPAPLPPAAPQPEATKPPPPSQDSLSGSHSFAAAQQPTGRKTPVSPAAVPRNRPPPQPPSSTAASHPGETEQPPHSSAPSPSSEAQPTRTQQGAKSFPPPPPPPPPPKQSPSPAPLPPAAPQPEGTKPLQGDEEAAMPPAQSEPPSSPAGKQQPAAVSHPAMVAPSSSPQRQIRIPPAPKASPKEPPPPQQQQQPPKPALVQEEQRPSGRTIPPPPPPPPPRKLPPDQSRQQLHVVDEDDPVFHSASPDSTPSPSRGTRASQQPLEQPEMDFTFEPREDILDVENRHRSQQQPKRTAKITSQAIKRLSTPKNKRRIPGRSEPKTRDLADEELAWEAALEVPAEVEPPHSQQQPQLRQGGSPSPSRHPRQQHASPEQHQQQQPAVTPLATQQWLHHGIAILPGDQFFIVALAVGKEYRITVGRTTLLISIAVALRLPPQGHWVYKGRDVHLHATPSTLGLRAGVEYVSVLHYCTHVETEESALRSEIVAVQVGAWCSRLGALLHTLQLSQRLPRHVFVDAGGQHVDAGSSQPRDPEAALPSERVLGDLKAFKATDQVPNRAARGGLFEPPFGGMRPAARAATSTLVADAGGAFRDIEEVTEFDEPFPPLRRLHH